jgi:hypothetical protein
LAAYDFRLVALHTMSKLSFHLRRGLGGSVCIKTKTDLFRFVEGQTRLSTS